MTATLSATDRYTIISADCHAGANHETYREYLDPAYLDDFDAWRNKYKNPFRDLQGRRARPQLGRRAPHRRSRRATASSARSCSPTRCRRSSRASCCSRGRRSRDEYEHRLAGIRAHNRWLADWCGAFPERRAGIGQIFLNDVDDAIDGRAVDQGARPARRRAHLRDPARRRLREAAVRPRVRPAVEGVRGPRGPGQRARRHRRARTTASTRSRTCSSSPRSASTRSARSCSSSSRACSSASRSSSSS